MMEHVNLKKKQNTKCKIQNDNLSTMESANLSERTG